MDHPEGQPKHLPGGALWDMDGVLVDSGEFHRESWARVLPEFGIDYSDEVFQRIFGMNNAGVIEIFKGDRPSPELLEEISDRKEALFRQLIQGRVQALPGVLDWLQRLDAWGVPQAVASSAPMANVDAVLDELDVRRYFEAVVSGAGLPSKPDPAVFLRAADAIHARPESCLVFEDAVAGVEAAKRAGMACVAVTTTNPAHDLQAADLVLDRLTLLSPEGLARLMAPH